MWKPQLITPLSILDNIIQFHIQLVTREDGQINAKEPTKEVKSIDF